MSRLFVYGIFSREFSDLLLFDFRVRAKDYLTACKKAQSVLTTLNSCDNIYILRPLNIDGTPIIPPINNEQLKFDF